MNDLEQQARKLLENLVRTKTVNPPGNEEAAALLVGERLADSGFSVEYHASEPKRTNVVARLKGKGKGLGLRLLFNGHLDTLPAGIGWRRDPFAATVEDGCLYGCGAFDMKAGIASMVSAVCAFAEKQDRFSGELIVTAVSDEIAGGTHGTRYVLQKTGLAADMAVVCEPSGEQVVVAHNGTLWLTVTVQGKAAHGGKPWLGVNAISKAALIIRALEEEIGIKFHAKSNFDGLIPSLNIGVIRGGERTNLVPDQCTFEIDRRIVPGEDIIEAEKEVHRVVQRIVDDGDDRWSASIVRSALVRPGIVSPEEPIIRECQRAFEDVMGQECGIGVTTGFEDAHYFIEAGIPTAMFGPYVPGAENVSSQAGGADEYVELLRVTKAAEIYYRLCCNLLL